MRRKNVRFSSDWRGMGNETKDDFSRTISAKPWGTAANGKFHVTFLTAFRVKSREGKERNISLIAGLHWFFFLPVRMNINIYHSESEEREKGSKKWMMMSLCVGSPQELIKKQDERWSKRESGKRCCNSKQLSARWGMCARGMRNQIASNMTSDTSFQQKTSRSHRPLKSIVISKLKSTIKHCLSQLD